MFFSVQICCFPKMFFFVCGITFLISELPALFWTHMCQYVQQIFLNQFAGQPFVFHKNAFTNFCYLIIEPLLLHLFIIMIQMDYLDSWAALQTEHSSSLSSATEALKARTLRLPVSGGAKVSTILFFKKQNKSKKQIS